LEVLLVGKVCYAIVLQKKKGGKKVAAEVDSIVTLHQWKGASKQGGRAM
jgi:hypothetical protein